MNAITAQGLALVKKYEGFMPEPYRCPTGHSTIGYGHVIKKGEAFTCLTEEGAHNLLLKDLEIAGSDVRQLVNVPLNDDQYSALCSWMFNLGNTASTRNSTLLKHAKKYHLVPGQFGLWIIGFIKGNPSALPGLIKRRADEALLFISKLEL